MMKKEQDRCQRPSWIMVNGYLEAKIYLWAGVLLFEKKSKHIPNNFWFLTGLKKLIRGLYECNKKTTPSSPHRIITIFIMEI